MVDALYSNNLLDTRDLPELVDRITCTSDSSECVARTCEQCTDRKAVRMANITSRTIAFYQWERIQDESTHFVSTKCIQVSQLVYL